MTDAPISKFLTFTPNLHVHDIAVLIWMVGLQERDGSISPIADTGKLVRLDGMTQEESAAAFKRLMESGEISWFEDDDQRGFYVTRFDALMEDIQEVGRKAYFRAARKARVAK